MKTVFLILMSCLTLTLSGYALADCDGGNCEEGACNPYESNCQCTDPICNRPAYSDCTSRARCCEAFGNVGGR